MDMKIKKHNTVICLMYIQNFMQMTEANLQFN